MQFRSSPINWPEQEDINWTEISTILSRFRADGNLGFSLTHAGGGAYSSTLRFTGTGAWQGYMYLNEDAEEFAFTSGPYAGQTDPARIRAARDRAQRETSFTSSWDLSSSVRPFFQSDVWGNTSFRHDVRGLLAQNTFDATEREREWEFGSWDSDNITRHEVSANLAANIMDHNQTITVSTVLPPRDASASFNATFRKWISTTNIRGTIQEPWDDDLRTFGNIHITETLAFTNRINFQQHIVFNPEEDQFTTLTSRLNVFNFNAAYSVLYARPWRFNPYFYVGSGLPLWQQQLDSRLEPQQFSLGYSRSFTQNDLWGRRLSFSVSFSTNMAFDLQRYTNSNMNFNLTVSTRITNFLDLSFSTVSQNTVLFRYFQNMPFFRTPPAALYAGQETNFFVDLLNSFRFDNEELRRQSGFKLRSMNVSLLHHLGDWNARLTIHSTPHLERIPGSAPVYRFRNEISFLVQWVPIGEIRTQIDYTDQRLRIR